MAIRIVNKIKSATNWLLDFIFPKYCLGCGKENDYLCADCFTSLPILTSIHCPYCGRRSPAGYACEACRNKVHPALVGLLVASDWNNNLLRQTIYCYKYNFVKELADPLSLLAINFLKLIPDKLKTDDLILVPVPLHRKRLLWRGFNQAELLAQKIGAHFNLPIYSVLERRRYTLPQAEIKNRDERHQNIAGAFKISDKFSGCTDFVRHGTVILIDDVSTTTSTLEECAKILKPLKPKEVWGLVIARG